MSTKTFLQGSGTVFVIVGAVHLVRLFTGWEIIIAGWTLPVWFSFFGVVIPWFLAYNAFVLSQKEQSRKGRR